MQLVDNNSVKPDVCGVTILYNPPVDVIQNINSYVDQINYLLIIDNSNYQSNFIKEYFKNHPKVEYIFNNDNLGIAKSLNVGARKAAEIGTAFLLTMDQDSKAPPQFVKKLFEIASSNENIGIVSPLHSNKYNTHINLKNYTKPVRVMTSGNLLSLNVYNKVGDFCEDYFIDYVDIEYCMRLDYLGFKVIKIDNVVLDHNEANITERKLFGKKIYPTNNSPFRWYYKTRNLLYLRKKYKNYFPVVCKEEVTTFLKNFIKGILFEDKKYLKLKMILLGFWDYIKNKKGRNF